MPLLAFGGWTFGVWTADWVNEATVLARIFNYDHLGQNTATRNQRLIDMMNRTIEDMLEANPDFAKTTATYSMPNGATFGANTIPIPEDMRGQDGVSIDYIDTSQGYLKLQHCFFLDDYGWQQLPLDWLNGTTKVRNPSYWGWDLTSQNIKFAPYPNDTTCQVQFTYRVKSTVIADPWQGTATDGTVSVSETSPIVSGVATDFDPQVTAGGNVTISDTPYDVDTVDSDTQLTLARNAGQDASAVPLYISQEVGEFPTRFQRVPALRLAALLIENINMPLYSELMQKFQQGLRDMQQEITKQLAAWQARTNQEARPNQVFDVSGLFLNQLV